MMSRVYREQISLLNPYSKYENHFLLLAYFLFFLDIHVMTIPLFPLFMFNLLSAVCFIVVSPQAYPMHLLILALLFDTLPIFLTLISFLIFLFLCLLFLISFNYLKVTLPISLCLKNQLRIESTNFKWKLEAATLSTSWESPQHHWLLMLIAWNM